MYTKLAAATSVYGLMGILALAPANAYAQSAAVVEDDTTSTSAEIVVTAQRREERSVDVPITVTTLGSEALETANVQDLSDITKITPGLRFDFASGYSQPTIRGVGTSVTSSGAVGNVGIYIDGFYSPNPIVSDMQLLKVSSIQVLKGPQGTLFGRNTTGGAILIQTAEPSTETGGEIKASYGRYNEFRAQAYATFGLAENIAMDAEGMYSRGDGWLTNISNGKKVGDYENWSARVGLKADLSDSLSVLLRYQHTQVDDPTSVLPNSYTESKVSSRKLVPPFIIANGAPFFAQPGQFTFDPDEVAVGSHPSDQQFFRSNSDIVQLTIRADLGFANLTSYSQYRKEDADSRIEGDYSGVEIFDIGLPNDNETITQELLLTSKPGNRLQWTAGLFYVRNRDTYRVFFDYFPSLPGFLGGPVFSRCCEFGSSSVSESYAAFIDATYEVTPKLFVTAGARYAYDKQSKVYTIAAFAPPPPNVPTDAEYDEVNGARITPRFVIRYKPTDETSVYASYSKGYKAAFLDLGSGDPNPVDPETIDAYEVGFKYSGRGLSFETAFFYYDYKDLQVSLYQNARAVIVNAASSEVYGLDGQLRYDLSDAFTVNFGATWLHARYKRFVNAPVYAPCLTVTPARYPNIPASDPVFGCALAGQSFPIVPTLLTNAPMQRSPEFSGNIGATYRTQLAGGGLTLSGNLSYTSKFFFGPSGIQFPQKGYEVLSLRAQWEDPSERFTIAAYGDNITNNRYRTAVQYGNNGIGSNWSKPITYGVEVGVKF